MTILARMLAALAVLAALALPHLITAPRAAHADFCSACADEDAPESVVLVHLPAAGKHALPLHSPVRPLRR